MKWINTCQLEKGLVYTRLTAILEISIISSRICLLSLHLFQVFVEVFVSSEYTTPTCAGISRQSGLFYCFYLACHYTHFTSLLPVKEEHFHLLQIVAISMFVESLL
jgi:hypothetical protein